MLKASIVYVGVCSARRERVNVNITIWPRVTYDTLYSKRTKVAISDSKRQGVKEKILFDLRPFFLP